MFKKLKKLLRAIGAAVFYAMLLSGLTVTITPFFLLVATVHGFWEGLKVTRRLWALYLVEVNNYARELGPTKKQQPGTDEACGS